MAERESGGWSVTFAEFPIFGTKWYSRSPESFHVANDGLLGKTLTLLRHHFQFSSTTRYRALPARK
jgi:hypothetical protein